MFLDAEGREIYRRTIAGLTQDKRKYLDTYSGDPRAIAKQIGVEPWIVRRYYETEQLKREFVVGGLCLAAMAAGALILWQSEFAPPSPQALEDRVIAPVSSRNF